MKILIASDIHGSAYYCRLMLDRFDKGDYDRLLILGDLLYHGPRNALPRDYDPKSVADMLNTVSDKILCVRGNCDAEVDQLMLSFPIFAEYALICDGESEFVAVHGHHLESAPKCGIILHGHTHIPRDEIVDGIRYINPGSVSIPKENSHNSVIDYENGIFTLTNL